jgi:hypothetical protein
LHVEFIATSSPGSVTGHSTNSGSGNNTVNCPICSELVAGRRFAPHLERCMNGGKRGVKRHYDYLHDEGTAKPPKAKSGDALELLDPLPTSLIVRIKLKNGGTCYRDFTGSMS